MSEHSLQLVVHRMTWEAEGVLSVELTYPDGKPLSAWTPGAHLDDHVGGQVRQYSLSAATSKETPLVLDALEMALWQRDRNQRS